MKKILLFTGLGILIFSFGFFAGSFWTANKLFNELPNKLMNMSGKVNEKEPERLTAFSMISDDSFWGHLFWGGNAGWIDQLEPLPGGNGILKGRFMLDEKPVEKNKGQTYTPLRK